jgi:hypothetical protein
MSSVEPGFVAEFLSFIEKQEERLIGWGFYDVAFDPSEIEVLFRSNAPPDLLSAWDQIEASNETFVHLMSEMRHAGLLYKVPDGGNKFRSRMAESVRLIAHLRQRFSADDWSSARRLISDVKIHLSPRRYPRVDVNAIAAWDAISQACVKPTMQCAAFEALSSRPDGGNYTFAGFQVRAFLRILSSYGKQETSGTVVCAGTGSGKTKAFYVPAFLGMATELGRNDPSFTKVISVYPRNVLLADQLREAIAEASKLSTLDRSFDLRRVTFGALLGDTPPENAFNNPSSLFLKNWKRHGNGWRVPFLRAPFHPSRCELVWLDRDRLAGRTTLFRVDGLNEEPEIPDGVIQLTREGIQTKVPDVLFLSLEMLHRELGNPDWSKPFGIGVEKTPRLLLLDEVHNYGGIAGAQAPWIIARWRQAARPAGIHVVGLSATLREAPSHLATIGCVRATRVVEVGPMDSELTAEGREVNLVVKGDASAGAPLLAGSIQVAMLASRMLTARSEQYPKGGALAGQALYLRKVFGFTDQLDSLNRWMADLRDAERNKRLAQYRLPPAKAGRPVSPAIERTMEQDGQIWSMSDFLGHDLAQAALVSRCSSQDPGADSNSDIIVATASLEVGYDDPDVGTVVHHKAPRSMSSFLQRKGRAGRRRGSRPTTIVVLSDYGRDRWFFQNSERLFQPEIDPIIVPLLNPYVMRVQATSFLIDWIGRRIRASDPFSYLRRFSSYHSASIDKAAELLRRLLKVEDEYEAFRRELGWMFRNTNRFSPSSNGEMERLVDAVLWEEPRSVMRSAVPSLLRKLEARWKYADPKKSNLAEDSGAKQPLPAFIPSATFSELDAAEIIVDFPSSSKEATSRALAPQLMESSPGRVSKRYSTGPREDGYWLQGSDALLGSGGTVILSIANLFPERLALDTGSKDEAYQPLRISLVPRPQNVKDSSNSQWVWTTRMTTVDVGRPVSLFASPEFKSVFSGALSFMHGDGSGLHIQRSASEGEFGLMLSNGTEQRGKFRLGHTTSEGAFVGESVGLGVTADGLTVEVASKHLEAIPGLEVNTLARLRQDFFRHRLDLSPRLSSIANRFTLDWISLSSVAMLTATALKNGCGLVDAQVRLFGKRTEAVGKILSRVFSAGVASDDDDDDQSAGGKMRDRLNNCWLDPVAAAEIELAERVLWEPLDVEFEAWLKKRHLRTLAEALLSAIVTVVPDIGDGDLIADVVERDEGVLIAISETSPGGLGQIEGFLARVADDRNSFERALLRGIEHCSRTESAVNLLHSVSRARTNGSLAKAFRAVRAAKGFTQASEAQAMLVNELEKASLNASRSVVVSLMGRVLRNGLNSETDAWISRLNKVWRLLEHRLGAVIEQRVFAYVCVSSSPVRRRLKQLVRRLTGEDPTDIQLFSIIQEFLLSACHDSCPQCLATTNRFVDGIRPSRELSLRWISIGQQPVAKVNVEPGWEDALKLLLRTHDRVDIVASDNDLASVGHQLQVLVTEPMDRDYVMVWPILGGTYREESSWRMRVEVRGME